MKFVAIALMCLLVAGCAGQMPGSIAGGECKIFHDPGFAVRGKRVKDSQWIGQTQEVGIEVCGWKRPAPEPVAKPARRPTPVAAAAPSPSAFAPSPPSVAAPVADEKPKKRHWYDRFRRQPAP